jgi:threonine aldolase
MVHRAHERAHRPPRAPSTSAPTRSPAPPPPCAAPWPRPRSGDDVYGEDPTVARLEAVVAALAGKEAGLFVPSGTMGNQIALAAHTKRGVEVIAPVGAHVYEYELGSMAVLSGLMPRLVPAPGGVPDPADVRAAISPGRHQAPTGLIVLENTHNKAGGTVVPLAVARAVAEVARDAGVPLHLDGARAWNAAVALGVPLADVCAPFDTVSLCLSKGLAAPVGSVLVGTRRVMDEAHRYRKMFGGGMRQVGVLAAAGLVAVTDGRPSWRTTTAAPAPSRPPWPTSRGWRSTAPACRPTWSTSSSTTRAASCANSPPTACRRTRWARAPCGW